MTIGLNESIHLASLTSTAEKLVRSIFLHAKDRHFTALLQSNFFHSGQNKSASTDDDLAVYTIATEIEEQVPTKVIDTTYLNNEEDLELLKEQDSFLYYSIPSIRKATFQGTDISMSSIKASASKIERKSRVSFECHPDLFDQGEEEDFDSISSELKLLGIEIQ